MADKSGVDKKTVYLDIADQQAIRELRKRYGLSTDADVIRLALRVLAASPFLQIQPSPPRGGKASSGSDDNP